MAWDYLTIQGSATPSEWAFSSGSLTGTKYCNHLNGVVLKSEQLLKSTYRNGHISAASDAQQHIDALIASFNDDDTTAVPIWSEQPHYKHHSIRLKCDERVTYLLQ